MTTFRRLLAAGAGTLALAGTTAGGAEAIGYNGGAFTATTPGSHIFTIGGAYDFVCSSVSATGTATGADTVALTTSFGGCSFLGFPATATASAPWEFMLIKPPPPPGNPHYRSALTWAPGTTTTLTVPIAGCSVVIAGGQVFLYGTGLNFLASVNQAGGVEITSTIYGATYTASVCPFSSGTDGQYTGKFFLPGIAIY